MNEATAETLNLWIQTAVVVAAIGASLVALIVGHLDRKSARAIAEADRQAARALAAEDRRASLEHSQLVFDMDVLLRLSRNIERAGHSDPQIAQDMAAEARALLHVLGPERLPITWADKRGSSLEDVAEYAARDDTPAYKKQAIEVHLELARVVARINELASRRSNAPA